MSGRDPTEQFVQVLTKHQNRLYAYIYSLVGDRSRAADVVQETNLVLWRKLDEFDPKRPFLPWAFGIARFQVLAHLRDRRRDRLLLDAELAEALSVDVEREAAQMEEMRLALRNCLASLSDASRELIDRRYYRGMNVQDVADAAERTVGATKVALLRIRRRLADCVQQRLANGAGA